MKVDLQEIPTEALNYIRQLREECREYRIQLRDSKAEVERLRSELSARVGIAAVAGAAK